MVFKFVQAYEKDGAEYISGRFVAIDVEEQDLLALMVLSFSEIPVYNNKFTANDKTLLFKSVRADLLMNSLAYIGKELEISLEYVIADNFVGDPEIVKKWVSK